MSMPINWEEVDKAAERKPYFGHGIWEVTIDDVDLEENSNGKPLLRFTVKGDGGEETNRATMFLTEKAIPWTMASIQGILVHNAKTDAGKDKVRNYLRGLKDASDLDLEKLLGATAWLEVTQSDRQFTRDDGTTGYYDDFRLLHYKPKQSPDDLVKEMIAGGEPVDTDDVPFK